VCANDVQSSLAASGAAFHWELLLKNLQILCSVLEFVIAPGAFQKNEFTASATRLKYS
jgi:hypothetical protein